MTTYIFMGDGVRRHKCDMRLWDDAIDRAVRFGVDTFYMYPNQKFDFEIARRVGQAKERFPQIRVLRVYIEGDKCESDDFDGIFKINPDPHRGNWQDDIVWASATMGDLADSALLDRMGWRCAGEYKMLAHMGKPIFSVAHARDIELTD